MRKLSFFPKLAAQSIKNNRRFYVPYILTVIGTTAAFYILSALFFDPGRYELAENTTNGAAYVQSFMMIGMLFLGIFSFIFLIYTNSFLMKRRQKEIGLYNVLGMGKGNIAAILFFEALYVVILGVGGGLAAGILLHKLCTLILYRLIHFPAPFGISVQSAAVALTALIFTCLLALTLLLNLARVGRSRPVELLRGGEVGEKEPKANWFLTALGVISLGLGYFIAVWTKDGAMAVALYFIAVFLVVIGTYCLFTSVSIAVLKALRANKRYYYKARHFITVSGMLYRMKRNAAGLANICIISTMVMVMISGTLSLYVGCDDIVNLSAPTDIVAQGRHYYHYTESESTPEEREPINPDALDTYVRELFAEARAEPTSGYQVEYLEISLEMPREGYDGLWVSPTVYFVTADTYAAITGEEAPQLAPGEYLLYSNNQYSDYFTGGFRYLISSEANGMDYSDPANYEFSREYNMVGECKNIANELIRSQAGVSAGDDAVNIIVVDGTDTLNEIGTDSRHGEYYWEGRYDFAQLSDEEQNALDEELWSNGIFDFAAAGCGYVGYFNTTTRVDIERDTFGLTGGFLFLGIFLGAVFLMAMVLIMYYKQVSEGYEDQRRFVIMRQVGLSEQETRRAIHSQILTVFFLPIVVAAVHIAFDFNLVVQLLSLFQLVNVRLTALCTLGTLGVFCAVYAVIYLITARSYSKIVESGARVDIQ
ncbi:MAG TPA: FtsX-like permease family protein [Candidatus Scatomorpha stercorigallinarum]|nr:FtsX-like permease family protein [Candidatus Scatomorpha stercorigallinarum]